MKENNLKQEQVNASAGSNAYYDKYFTETSEGLDIEANNISVNCITSKNNKFSIDENGNISCNTITANNINIPDVEIDYNKIYPVGSIYLSVNSTNPKNLFGGTWSRIAQGRVLVGVDTSDTDFNTPKKTGGSKYLQNHRHRWTNTIYQNAGTKGYEDHPFEIRADGDVEKTNFLYTEGVIDPGQTGNSGNLQPYFTCYIWQRIS